MADTKQKPTSEDIAGEKPDAPAEDEASFTVERLLGAESYEILGHDGHIVAGAFAGVAPSKEVSLKDARQRVRDWLKAEVTTDERE